MVKVLSQDILRFCNVNLSCSGASIIWMSGNPGIAFSHQRGGGTRRALSLGIASHQERLEDTQGRGEMGFFSGQCLITSQRSQSHRVTLPSAKLT